MPKKILLIEDDSALADNLAAVLKSAGHEVFVANDGDAGYRTAQDKIPDIILLDLVLPKKHGFKVMEELQANPELKEIPVMVLTNLETAHDIERASSFGVKAYLVKANYSLGEILKKVDEILGVR